MAGRLRSSITGIRKQPLLPTPPVSSPTKLKTGERKAAPPDQNLRGNRARIANSHQTFKRVSGSICINFSNGAAYNTEGAVVDLITGEADGLLIKPPRSPLMSGVRWSRRIPEPTVSSTAYGFREFIELAC